MVVVLTGLTVGQAATIINAAIAFLQYTMKLSIVTVLIFGLYNINTAHGWTIITQTLHSSFWPILLQSDSVSLKSAKTRISLIISLAVLGDILATVAGVFTPLGFEDGMTLNHRSKPLAAKYFQNTSPMGLATSPRDKFTFGRRCTSPFYPLPCPGNEDNTTKIAASRLDIFSSTPFGPFNIQHRRYYKGPTGSSWNNSLSSIASFESFILRDDIFATEGLIVDLSDSPGIGFLNHTLPSLSHGGVWSTDVLWLEPVSSCVNKNITVGWTLREHEVDHPLSVTDRGGFYNLSPDLPIVNSTGQSIDLNELAYGAASLDNSLIMASLNITRSESYDGRTFPAISIFGGPDGYRDKKAVSLRFPKTANYSGPTPQHFCENYRYDPSATIADVNTVGIHCGIFLGPSERVDGGDSRVLEDNIAITRDVYACASATRARMQTVRFSFNGTTDLSNLHISRQNTNTSVLWAVENTSSLYVNQVDLYWGRVADSYEYHPSLSTLRSEIIYLPAGQADSYNSISDGFTDTPPSTIGARAWSKGLYLSHPIDDLLIHDYSGSSNFALLTKWRTLLKGDPVNGPAHIINLIWTDIMANNVVGTHSMDKLWVAKYTPSVSFRLVYGIPVALLSVVWLPLLLIGITTLATRVVKPSHIKHLLNQTSVGRVVTETSALRVASTQAAPVETSPERNSTSVERRHNGDANKPGPKNWAMGPGQTIIAFGKSKDGLQSEEDPKTPPMTPAEAGEGVLDSLSVTEKKCQLTEALSGFTPADY